MEFHEEPLCGAHISKSAKFWSSGHANDLEIKKIAHRKMELLSLSTHHIVDGEAGGVSESIVPEVT